MSACCGCECGLVRAVQTRILAPGLFRRSVELCGDFYLSWSLGCEATID